MRVVQCFIKSKEQLLVSEMTTKSYLLLLKPFMSLKYIKVLLVIFKLEQKEKQKLLKEELCSFGTTFPKEMRAS